MSFSTNFVFAKLRALFVHVRYVLMCLRAFARLFFTCYVPIYLYFMLRTYGIWNIDELKSTYSSMPNFDKIFLKYEVTLNWMTLCKYNGSRKIMIYTLPNFAGVKICSHNLICMSLNFTFILVHLCIKS